MTIFLYFPKQPSHLLEYRLHINESKSQLCRHEVTFLGFDVNQDGLKINPGKIHEVVEFTVPKNLNELRKFLGMTGFLRRFIAGFSNFAAPLYDLLKKKRERLFVGSNMYGCFQRN